MKRLLRWSIILIFVVVAGLWAFFAGNLLIVDNPRPSQVILALNGEFQTRPAKAVALMRRGLAPRVILSVPAREYVYGVNLYDLAERWVEAQPDESAITLCPVIANSTKDESHAVQACLPPDIHSVLIVTSADHTRRALAIFRHEDPDRTYSVAAAHDALAFGTPWWRHREWAKNTVIAWAKMIWWQSVERWV